MAPKKFRHVSLKQRLCKAVVRNDVNEIQRLIDVGIDVNSDFSVGELIHYKLIDSNAITILRNAEITFDNLAESNYKQLKVGRDYIAATKTFLEENTSCSKVIILSIHMNVIILATEAKLSLLQIAIMYGWNKGIVKLITKGANPNKALDIQGTTCLQLMCTVAFFRNKPCCVFDEEIIQLLFDYGADPNVQDIAGRTFLYYVAVHADFKIEELLIEMRKTPNSETVCDHNVLRRIDNILINGANPNIKDNYEQCTILYCIVEYDHYLHEQPDLNTLLLDHGCSYGTYEDILNSPSIVKMKQDYGIHFDIENAKDQVDGFNSEHKDHVDRNNSLFNAVKSKNVYEINNLLSNGSSSNIRDNNGLSVMHYAVKHGDYSVTELLLNKGANPNIKSWENGTTPLFNAVINNRIDMAELLLKHRANPCVLNTNGMSPLYFSIIHNYQEMTEVLLKYGANPYILSQVSLLFNLISTVKDDTNMELIESSIEKIKNIAVFLKSKEISVDYSLYYKPVTVTKQSAKISMKKVMELLDNLSISSNGSLIH